jgi:hypothetical protein
MDWAWWSNERFHFSDYNWGGIGIPGNVNPALSGTWQLLDPSSVPNSMSAEDETARLDHNCSSGGQPLSAMVFLIDVHFVSGSERSNEFFSKTDEFAIFSFFTSSTI